LDLPVPRAPHGASGPHGGARRLDKSKAGYFRPWFGGKLETPHRREAGPPVLRSARTGEAESKAAKNAGDEEGGMGP